MNPDAKPRTAASTQPPARLTSTTLQTSETVACLRRITYQATNPVGIAAINPVIPPSRAANFSALPPKSNRCGSGSHIPQAM